MDASNSPGLTVRAPKLTLLIAGAALVLALFPRWAPGLVYDRSAILHGQIWRMFTGHWVHFSTRHLVFDLAPLVAGGSILEARALPRFGWFCAMAPWAISAALVVFEPRMDYYAGLSGLDVAVVVLLALNGLGDPPPWRWVCVAVTVGIAGKIALELATGRGFFGAVDNLPARVSVVGHVAGAMTALSFYLAERRAQSVCRAIRLPSLSRTTARNP
jgi:rhomboid family GlyGly-CTERM serine protease